MKIVTLEKDLGVAQAQNLKPSSHVDSVVFKANRMLGMIYHAIEVHKKDIILPLYRALVRPHLEYCVQAWKPYYQKDIDKLERGPA